MELGQTLRGWFGERILGPDKPAVARVKTMNIRKIVIKLESEGIPVVCSRKNVERSAIWGFGHLL